VLLVGQAQATKAKKWVVNCDASDREDELRVQTMSNGSSKRFKISKNVDSFDE
jgi:hypothetical protein